MKQLGDVRLPDGTTWNFGFNLKPKVGDVIDLRIDDADAIGFEQISRLALMTVLTDLTFPLIFKEWHGTVVFATHRRPILAREVYPWFRRYTVQIYLEVV
ncbi:hypothetical protein SIID45300_01737 [Candidatus Magnetaquicoccaceae bacterium FCR-1]|uniref:Uncharacterized protein n=1 Tax=Candidatus Magnetaquiglobus chichijimensis TaxID=3141448 RepID=A0ABQ0C943_9PROT